MSARPALGRGLNALIPPAPAPVAAPAPPTALPIHAIRPNPDQPRTHLQPAGLEELAASIREHGVLQPILVSRAPDAGYVLIAGERRWRAAQLAGLTEVPVVISDSAESDRLTLALVENIQRQDLTPLEEAQAYQRLVREAQLTQAAVAQRVGKSRVSVTNSLRLLQLPSAVRASLAAGEISAGHARAILAAPSAEQQLQLWERVRTHNLSVRETERAARQQRTEGAPAGAPSPRALPGDQLAQQRLQTALGTKVQVQRGRRGGRLLIRWYNDEQLEQIVNLVTRAAAAPSTPLPTRIDI